MQLPIKALGQAPALEKERRGGARGDEWREGKWGLRTRKHRGGKGGGGGEEPAPPNHSPPPHLSTHARCPPCSSGPGAPWSPSPPAPQVPAESRLAQLGCWRSPWERRHHGNTQSLHSPTHCQAAGRGRGPGLSGGSDWPAAAGLKMLWAGRRRQRGERGPCGCPGCHGATLRRRSCFHSRLERKRGRGARARPPWRVQRLLAQAEVRGPRGAQVSGAKMHKTCKRCLTPAWVQGTDLSPHNSGRLRQDCKGKHTLGRLAVY